VFNPSLTQRLLRSLFGKGKTIRDYYRSYVLPADTPKDRVQVLRKALQETMKDPEFLADAAKSRLDVDPVTGEQLETLIRGLFELSPSVTPNLRESCCQVQDRS